MKKRFSENVEKNFCYLSEQRYISLSAVENGDSVIPMLSDRSFDMQKQCPILPHGNGKNPRFDPFKGNIGVCIKRYRFSLKLQNGNDLHDFLSRN